MEFLKDLALPQSLEHFHLVVLLAGLSALVFIPYLSVALGSAVLSLRLNHIARRENNPTATQFARALMEVAFFSKGLVTFLAVIPGLSLVFSLAQILQSTPSIAVGLAGFGFLFLLIGCTLLYAYRYTFRVQGLLDSYQNLIRKLKADDDDGIDSYRQSNTEARLRTGRYGTMFLGVAAFLYTAAIGITVDPTAWISVDSLFVVLLSPAVWVRFLLFLSFAAGATGLSIFFFTYAWSAGEHGEDEAYAQIARRYGTHLSVVGLLAIPIFLVLNVLFVSSASLAGIVYVLAGAALILFFLSAHFVYAHIQTPGPTTAAYALFAFLLGGSLLVIDDYVAVGFATRTHAVVLAAEHERATEDLRAQLGVTLVTFTGEDIYNGRCSACHLFDQKKVGPPYTQTIPKYQGKKADLIAFILNPVKKNPEYPSMPNPGLKPAEADSIASYILAKVAATKPVK